MKKKKQKFLLMLSMLCAISSQCLRIFASETTGFYQISTETVTYHDIMTVEYPVIVGIEGFDQTVIDEINLEYYNAAQNAFLQDGEWMDEIYQELTASGSSYADYISYEVKCESVYVNEDILSVAQLYYYYTGGAHPYHYMVGSSYNLKTGKKLSMGELLGCDDSTAIETVVDAYRQTIIGKVESITEESVRGALNEAAYWMADDGMHVSIAQYVIASYAAGPQEVVIPKTNVANTVTPSGFTESLPGLEQPQNNTNTSEEKITIINGIQANASDFIFPYSSTTLLTDEDLVILEGSSVNEEHFKSQLAINEILARYGYVFSPEKGGSAKEAYDRFEGLDWYNAAKPYCPSDSANEMLYTYFSSTELRNVEIICAWQEEHGCYY